MGRSVGDCSDCLNRCGKSQPESRQCQSLSLGPGLLKTGAGVLSTNVFTSLFLTVHVMNVAVLSF